MPAIAQDNPAPPVVAGFERFAGSDALEPVQAGQLLIGELRCTACHADGNASPLPGPNLQAAGLRLRSQWMLQFIEDPQAVKPGTTMPNLLGQFTAKEKRSIAESIVAFLRSQRRPYQEIKATGAQPVPYRFWERGNPQHGAELYHQSGCVACHAADQNYQPDGGPAAAADDRLAQLLEELDPEELAELGLDDIVSEAFSIPHADLAQKYTSLGLTRFLLDPLSTRPGGRMPDMKLAPVEAADLAAYLIERDDAAGDDGTTAPARSVPTADAQRIADGKKWFRELRCVQCHAADGVTPPTDTGLVTLAALRSAETARCSDSSADRDSAARHRPDYSLNEAQQQAILAALRTAGSPQPEATAAQRVHQELLRQNCYACHRRDSVGGVGRDRRGYFATVDHIDLGDEGRLPPPLTAVGRKLTVPWMSKVLKGQKADVRPHMLARMPVFATEATKTLPALFAAADEASQATSKTVFGDTAQLADAGRQLMDTGCVQCHAFDGQSMPGVMGVDIRGIGQRMHPQWFADFLMNPGKLKPRTRMPTFFQNGESQDKQLLGGDPQRQIAAMWTYLNASGKPRLPEKLETARATNYELIPNKRPVVLRTFMREAGTHAIAVGYPHQVHLAYDALNCRPALLWRGRFLDAQGTWFVRFTPPADPLGSDPVPLPDDFPIISLRSPQKTSATNAQTDTNTAPRFDGYRLDSHGTPTFLSHGHGLRLSERWEPHEQGFRRTLTIEGLTAQTAAQQLALRLHGGPGLTSKTPYAAKDESGLQLRLLDASNLKNQGLAPELQERAGQSQWLLPLAPAASEQASATIVIQYSW
ncbi:c-type cytochrome [Roseimaritima ulvae]|uniref:c-type cytochrome n=1 Tax=Roseimaritima ulvae TaxID=980254 RepID=UPI00138FC6D4|nr:c-type cytochrome [Roseimaritima ulvae]